MRLQLFDRQDRLLGEFDDDAKMLGAYAVEDFMRLHVVDLNPARRAGEFSDVSRVPKYEMPDDEYARRPDSVRAFKERHKLGRFADQPVAQVDAADARASDAERFAPGQRCLARVGELDARGTVRFAGPTGFGTGLWVGVELDEPVGKNDGSVQGTAYFACADRHGVFLRPHAVELGDFPEEDFEM
jgi:tubulin-folding cofactor B